MIKKEKECFTTSPPLQKQRISQPITFRKSRYLSQTLNIKFINMSKINNFKFALQRYNIYLKPPNNLYINNVNSKKLFLSIIFF